LDVSDGTHFNILLDETLEIPFPCLLTVKVADQSLPHSRLLTDVDRVSRSVFLAKEVKNTGAESFVLLASSWVDFAPQLSWVAVGFQHIVPEGLDHMLFILGLFFLASGWRPLLLQVTAFTLAHSLTLGMSMYGIISVPVSIVEPLIALSIVYVAVDNLFSTKIAPFRVVVVCSFGLLHGLGFASVLTDIGLPQEQFLITLGLFNLGVEFGQLAVIAFAFLIVGWFRRQLWYQTAIAQPATIAIAGTGAYWFLKRITF
jgi:hydrogenase/urease accessory protein HupE